MVDVFKLKPEERSVFKNNQLLFENELQRHIYAIENIIDIIVKSYGKEISKMTEEELDYISQATVVRIFALDNSKQNSIIQETFFDIATDIDEKHAKKLDNTFSGMERRIATLVVKVILVTGSLRKLPK